MADPQDNELTPLEAEALTIVHEILGTSVSYFQD
jgi:hypothetical protein